MICKFCGNENPDELQYCTICGKELQNTLLRSLVGINPDGSFDNNNYSATLGGVPKKGFEDTGGGAASGPRQTMQERNNSERGGSAGAVIATVAAILVILAVAAYFMIFAQNAPFAYLREYLPF